MAVIIGNIIAATACADIQNEENADSTITPRSNILGEWPNHFRNISAILLLKPVLVTAEARINAPRIKKTA